MKYTEKQLDGAIQDTAREVCARLSAELMIRLRDRNLPEEEEKECLKTFTETFIRAINELGFEVRDIVVKNMEAKQQDPEFAVPIARMVQKRMTEIVLGEITVEQKGRGDDVNG